MHNIGKLRSTLPEYLWTKKGEWIVTTLLYAILGTTVIHANLDKSTTFVMHDFANILAKYHSINKFDNDAFLLFYDHKINRIYIINVRNGYCDEYYFNN